MGGLNIKNFYQEDALALFIQPPTIEILKNRLQGRGTESPESLQKRIDKAQYELSFAPQFDKIIINDDLETACKDAQNIINNFLCQK